jgi:penicillin-binding protein 2B
MVLKRKINKRSQFTGAIFLLLFFAIMYRFYILQVVDASIYQEATERLYNKESILQAKRGTVYDRNGETLAKEATSYTAVAILSTKAPVYVKDPFVTAQKLAPILEMSVDQLYKLMTQEERYQVELRPGGWKLDRDKMQQIRELELPGVMFIEEPKRYYPNNDFASHVIGFMNHDGTPVMGLEASLDNYLQGEDGRIHFTKDGRGNPLPQGMKEKETPTHGKDVYLTLDERIQLYIEQAIDEAQEKYTPEKITVIAANPKTGEILGMSSRPSFNPNAYSDIENYVNHAVSSTFEPGSTFKIITLAAAVEEDIYNGEETYQSGSIRVPGGTINDHQPEGWGRISFLEGVQKSSNVAFTILGWDRMPREVFYHYINRFGFGEVTGIDLPGESRGRLNPSHSAREIDVATMTFGQGVSVTAIQQIAAVNAIANGGKLIKPYIIDRIEDSNTGKIIFQNEPHIVHDQVVSKETASKVADILETVVTVGTGRNFYIDGYHLAGKTGTAQKVGKDGKYIIGQHIHSFIGFAPKDNPQIALYVLVDAPTIPDYRLGGSVVASIYKSIMVNSLQYLSVVPQFEEVKIQMNTEQEINIPNFTGMSIMKARQAAELSKIEVIVLGEGAKVTNQYPGPEDKVLKSDRIYLIAGNILETTIPDFKGWSHREVRDWANMAKVELVTNGSGFVIDQSKEAGASLKKGQQINIELKPKHDKPKQEMEPRFFMDYEKGSEQDGEDTDIEKTEADGNID